MFGNNFNCILIQHLVAFLPRFWILVVKKLGFCWIRFKKTDWILYIYFTPSLFFCFRQRISIVMTVPCVAKCTALKRSCSLAIARQVANRKRASKLAREPA